MAKNRNTKGVSASAPKPTTAEATNDAVGSSGPAVVEHVPDAPQLQTAAETLSTDTPESAEPQGGSGDPAAPAEQDRAAAEEVLETIGAGDLETIGDTLEQKAKAAFVARYPHVAAAAEAWRANGNQAEPTAIRIVAKRDGFRRAGIAHSVSPVEHQLESIRLPEQLEQLLAEPNLTVELI